MEIRFTIRELNSRRVYRGKATVNTFFTLYKGKAVFEGREVLKQVFVPSWGTSVINLSTEESEIVSEGRKTFKKVEIRATRELNLGTTVAHNQIVDMATRNCKITRNSAGNYILIPNK